MPYRLAMDAWLNNRNAIAVSKGVEPSSSGRQPDIISRYTTGPDGRNYWLRSSVSALSAQCSAIELSSYMVGRAGFEPANPEEAELQSAAFSHLRYLPKWRTTEVSISTPDSALRFRDGTAGRCSLLCIWRRAQDSNLQACRPTVFKTAPSPPGHTAFMALMRRVNPAELEPAPR